MCAWMAHQNLLVIGDNMVEPTSSLQTTGSVVRKTFEACAVLQSTSNLGRSV